MEELLLNILKEQVKPALGCTEPIAIALACAKAREIVTGELKGLEITTSKGLYKNAFSVGIPGTKEQGIAVAAALGVICGQSKLELEVLKKVTPFYLDEAKKLISLGKVKVKYLDDVPTVYVKCELETEEQSSTVCIVNSHSNFSYIKVDEQIILDNIDGSGSQEGTDYTEFQNLKLEDLLQEILKLKVEDLVFLREGIKLNKEIAAYGLKNERGLGIAQGLNKLVAKHILEDNIIEQARREVAAASDARMNGAELPVMTSCGSGNQGILVILPVALIAKKYKKEEDELLYALAIGHLVNAYVKVRLGKLAPVCGAAVSASVGLAASVTWLLGGNFLQMEGAMQTVLGNLSGMFCDGAKATCCLKVATSASEALTAAFLASENVYPKYPQGIVGMTIEESLDNLVAISQFGMANVDSSILNILGKR